MATALNISAENLECSVCFEIFRNAHFLRCGHTFCKECIDNSSSANEIICPKCRKVTRSNDVTKDFNTCQLVEGLLANKAKTNREKSGDCCDVCKDVNRGVTGYCEKCTELMCRECTKAHRGSKASSDHTIIEIDSLAARLKSKISEKIKTLNDCKLKIEHSEKKAQDDLAKVYYCQQELCQSVDRHINALIVQLKKHGEELKKNIASHDDGFVLQLKHYINKVKQLNDEISNKLSVFDAMLQLHEVSLLKDFQDSGNEEVNFPDFPVNKTSQCTIRVGKFIDLHSVITLDARPSKKAIERLTPGNIGGKILTDANSEAKSEADANSVAKSLTYASSGGKCLTPVNIGVKSLTSGNVTIQTKRIDDVSSKSVRASSTIDYRSLAGKELKVVARCRLEIMRMCEVNDNLWLTDCDCSRILVYNKVPEKVAEIKHAQMKNPRGMTVTDDRSVVVASETGLHIVGTNFAYRRCMMVGNYRDVFYYNTLYAINEETHCVDIYHLISGKWARKHSINISQINIDYYLRIFVTQNDIIVSNAVNVYVHNYEGEVMKHFKQSFGTGVGEFKQRVLCGVDDYNTYIYCDRDNDRLQLCDEYGRYTVIPLPDGAKFPEDVVADQNAGDVWLICEIGIGTGLCKFKLK